MRLRGVRIMAVLGALFALCPSISAIPCQTSSVWKTIPKKASLKNGITVIHERDLSSARSVVQVLIKGGKRAEPLGKEGLAYLTTRLAINIPDENKIQDLMDQATRLNVDSERDYSFIIISCLTENLEDSLETTTKIMLNPLFSGIRIDALKRQMQRRLDTSEDDSIVIAHNALFDVFFGGTAYAGSVYGTEESLESIKKKDIENFYKKHFIGSNMIVSVSSDLEEEAILNIIAKYFTKFPDSLPPEEEPLAFVPTQEKLISKERDTEQTLVSFAYILEGITAQNLILASMLENLLGKGFHSKLWPLRIRQKLAYIVDARASQMREAGLIEAFLETDNAKKDRALEELEKVMSALFQDGLTPEELESTKTNTKAEFLRNNENKDERAMTMAYFEALNLGYDFINRYFEETDAISLEEFNGFIKKALDPEKAIRIIVGPKSLEKDSASILSNSRLQLPHSLRDGLS